jgi:hypothetical protein
MPSERVVCVMREFMRECFEWFVVWCTYVAIVCVGVVFMVLLCEGYVGEFIGICVCHWLSPVAAVLVFILCLIRYSSVRRVAVRVGFVSSILVGSVCVLDCLWRWLA